jgi:glycosyltransferase involved in cell wall biosynthesis
MRVLHVSCIAPPEHGGIGRVAAIETRLLQECGVDTHLASLTTHAGIRIGNAGRIYALEHLVRDMDIVHLHYPFFGTAERLASFRRKGMIKRLVMTLHMDATADGWKGKIFDAYRWRYQSRVLDAADALCASSRDYVVHSSFAPYADRVIDLPFGVDETRFCPGSTDRLRLGISADVPLVLFVGGMDVAHAFKGVPELLEAIAGISDAHLLLVGDGALRKRYEDIAAAHGVSDRCHFLGAVSDDQLPEVYRAADVLAFPSTSAAEAFGLVAVEAQACGIPVVASDLPGVRTVVASGETGVLVPPKDVDALRRALSELLSHPEQRHTMGRAARARVLERYTWSTHIRGLMEIYSRFGS